MNKLLSLTTRLPNPLKHIKPTRAFCWNTEDELKGTITTRNDRSGHYLNPEEVSRKILRIIASHDNIENAHELTLGTTFVEMKKNGMDELSKVEIFLEVEREFFIQLPDEAVERFLNLREAVEYVSRSFHAM